MEKLIIYTIIGVTGFIGGYLPVLFGTNALGLWSILGSALGGIVGIVIIYKAKQNGYL